MRKRLSGDPGLMYALAFLAVVILIWIPVSRTVSLAQQFFALRNEISIAKKNGKKKISEKDVMMLIDDNSPQTIFAAISKSSQAEGVIIRQVELPKSSERNTVIVQSQTVSMEGNFIKLLKSMDGLADDVKPAKIASINFIRQQAPQKKEILVGTIVFESVKLASHE